MFSFVRRYKWDLGISSESEGHRYDNPQWKFHIIKAPLYKWYADPFILDVTKDKIYLLVEELRHKTNKGRLAKLTIDRNTYKILEEKIILELSDHLSFPAISRVGDEIFVYPENSASGKCILYKYNLEQDVLTPVSDLSNLPLTDAVMLNYNGRHYIFSTRRPNQNGNRLYIYHSENRFVSYSEIQQIEFQDNVARSAGDFIFDDGKIIRPAQDCNGGYGKGLVFQKIRCSHNVFYIDELFRKYPPKGYTGMHTYNSFKGYTVVDLHARRFPKLHRTLQRIKHYFAEI